MSKKHIHNHSHGHDHACSHDHGHDHDYKDEHGGGHSHSHGHHGHAHLHGAAALGNIRFAFALNLTFSILELVGGIWIGSLAIVADAIHDFGDSVSLASAWFFEKLANRKRDSNFNFGYRRFSLLSALISGIVITAGSAVVIYESIRRFSEARPPASTPMIVFAIFGLAINGFAAWKLSRGQTQNEKLLTWHLIEDVAGWGVVLVGAIVISITKWSWVDPALAIGLAIFVSYNVFKHLRETAYLFLQGRPQSFDEQKFLRDVLAIEGVEQVDQLAVWSLDGEWSVLSARLHLHAVRNPLQIEEIKEQIRVIAGNQKARATLETCLAKEAPHEDELPKPKA